MGEGDGRRSAALAHTIHTPRTAGNPGAAVANVVKVWVRKLSEGSMPVTAAGWTWRGWRR